MLADPVSLFFGLLLLGGTAYVWWLIAVGIRNTPDPWEDHE